MPKLDLTGRSCGFRVITGRGSYNSIRGEQKWKWVCACGNAGESDGSRLIRSKSCAKCAPRRTVRRGVPKAASPGDRFGIWEIVEVLEYEGGSGRKRPYRGRCTRCGAEATKDLTAMKYALHRCAECRFLHLVAGRLMSFDEIERTFGIKKSLIHSRRCRRGMTLEDAIFTPVQVQGRKDGRKFCTCCEREYPVKNFSPGASRCRKCRSRS